MAMNYTFANLLGAPYRGGNLVIHGNELLSAVGNRVSMIDLADNVSSTLPFETIQQVRTLCVSPDGQLLLAIDDAGRALLVNKPRRALLHHVSFKGPVAAAQFSPDGSYVACAVGRTLQVWRAPTLAKVMAPLQLHRTYGGFADRVTCLDWSADSSWIAVGCKDLTCRVYSLHPQQDYRPPTLAGHKSSIVGVYFAGDKISSDAAIEGIQVPVLYSISRDGAVHGYSYIRDEAGRSQSAAGSTDLSSEAPAGTACAYTGGEWKLSSKQYLMQRSAKVSAVDLHRGSGLLLVAYNSGTFDLYQMPAFTHLQALSVTRHRITSATFNETGNWVALGCAELGQLLVWDWRQESYVLKQQGHSAFIAAAAFSPNGSQVATAADDSKVKVWSLATGICSVTFADHASAVTALAWLPNGGALLSASLDGTVRAFDLVRYRNFRTFTSPQPVQFCSMAVDPSGEVVCAGSLDTFQIFVWSVKTGRLLDILAAHEGPVVALAFSPTQAVLASVSWDRTLRTWDVFSGKGGIEVLQHSHDVLAVAFRPDGKQLATATLDGQIHFWDPQEGELQGTIEGRRDIAGGRLMSDRRSAANSTSGQCFSSLAYSADGSFLLAGGRSKFVCLYGAQDRILMRRFQLSHNQSLDGVLDQLNSKNVTDAGPVQLLDDDDSADELELLGPAGPSTDAGTLPGAGRGKAAVIRCRAVALSPTGRSWVAATTEGALLYSLDDGSIFDPTDLAEDVTVEAAHRALQHSMYLKALLLALRLKEAELLEHVLLSTPEDQVANVAASVPSATVVSLLTCLAEALASSPHLEFMLAWVHALCTHHGNVLQVHSSSTHSAVLPALRAVQKSLFRVHEDISTACQTNVYTLQFLTA